MDNKTRHSAVNALLDDYYKDFKFAPKGVQQNRLEELIGENKVQHAGANPSEKTPEVKNNINMSINLTEGGRVVTQTDDPNTTVTTNVNRGLFR
jgi:hypothetical protein